MKVITPIGAVVEVDESVYQNNKNFLKVFKSENITEMVDNKAIMSKDTKKKGGA